jgi:hypothetical protein
MLPIPMPIQYTKAQVNFLNRVRNDTDTPIQFIYNSADCRIFPTPEMVLNITETWLQVAEVAWGNNGALNQSRCVPGSVVAAAQSSGGSLSSTLSARSGTSATSSGARASATSGGGVVVDKSHVLAFEVLTVAVLLGFSI